MRHGFSAEITFTAPCKNICDDKNYTYKKSIRKNADRKKQISIVEKLNLP